MSFEFNLTNKLKSQAIGEEYGEYYNINLLNLSGFNFDLVNELMIVIGF